MRRPALTAVAALVLAGCGFTAEQPAGADERSGTITVFAAASLTGSFTALGEQFEAANPGTTVRFSFGPSSGLAQQISQGAPADVFASASARNMQRTADTGAVETPTDFAANVMQIAVPPANPARITQLSDLARPGVKVALCAEAVPCGSTARKVFANAGLAVTPVTNETDVKATLTKVQLGEVDAGVVYVTDVLAAGDKVRGIEIPAELNASTSYPIATTTESANDVLADAFVDFVLSDAGAKVLTEAGFQRP